MNPSAPMAPPLISTTVKSAIPLPPSSHPLSQHLHTTTGSVDRTTTPQPTREPAIHEPAYKAHPELYPDRASFAASADPQAQSLFFHALPPEIRCIIYGYMWSSNGFQNGIHIDVRRPQDPSSSAAEGTYEPLSYPCLLEADDAFRDEAVNAEIDALWDDHEARGKLGEYKVARRFAHQPEVTASGLPYTFAELKNRRARGHLDCWFDYSRKSKAARERQLEAGESRDVAPTWQPLLPVLLTCKRLYV